MNPRKHRDGSFASFLTAMGTESEKQFGELFERMEQIWRGYRKTKRYFELSTEEKKVCNSMRSIRGEAMKSIEGVTLRWLSRVTGISKSVIARA